MAMQKAQMKSRNGELKVCCTKGDPSIDIKALQEEIHALMPKAIQLLKTSSGIMFPAEPEQKKKTFLNIFHIKNVSP